MQEFFYHIFKIVIFFLQQIQKLNGMFHMFNIKFIEKKINPSKALTDSLIIIETLDRNISLCNKQRCQVARFFELQIV